jgi:hypothetical protein
MHDASLLTHTHSPIWARKVLLWLLLAFAAAIASPLVQPRSIELLCTGTGSVKLLVGSADDADSSAGMAPDCALCAQASLPVEQHAFSPAISLPRVPALRATALLRTALQAAPPLPARGPPRTLRA